jgi:hypothetical protein
LISHYGIANDFNTWLTRTESGALPDNVFHELVAMADSNLVEKKTALESATPPPLNQGATKKHKIKLGNKYYTYNGTGDTADLKNYTEVAK